MTDHPLTEEAVAEMWDEHHTPASPILRWELAHESERKATLALLRAAFDAGREHERANPDDDRPWEPLAEGAPLNVGYEVRQEHNGVTTTGVVGRVDVAGDPWTAEGIFIGVLEYGTWHVRRPARELPTKLSAVIVPAGDHETITATDPDTGTVWRTWEAASISSKHWMGVWRNEDGTISSVVPAAWIDADTWQEDSA